MYICRKAYTNKKTGELYKVGEIATFPLLADTLETIAKEGPQTFYNGTLSQKILLDLQEGSMKIFFNTVKHAHAVTSIKQLPLLNSHLY